MPPFLIDKWTNDLKHFSYSAELTFCDSPYSQNEKCASRGIHFVSFEKGKIKIAEQNASQFMIWSKCLNWNIYLDRVGKKYIEVNQNKFHNILNKLIKFVIISPVVLIATHSIRNACQRSFMNKVSQELKSQIGENAQFSLTSYLEKGVWSKLKCLINLKKYICLLSLSTRI